MTVWDMMNTLFAVPVLTAALVLLTLQTALVFASFRVERSRMVKAVHILHFFVSFLLVYLPLMNFKSCVRFPEEKALLPGLMLEYASLPAALIVIYEGISGLVIMFRISRNKKRVEKNLMMINVDYTDND